MMGDHEYVCIVQHKGGGTEAVTVRAWNEWRARDKLLKMGYHAVLKVN